MAKPNQIDDGASAPTHPTSERSIEEQAQEIADRVTASLVLDELKKRHPDWDWADGAAPNGG